MGGRPRAESFEANKDRIVENPGPDEMPVLPDRDAKDDSKRSYEDYLRRKFRLAARAGTTEDRLVVKEYESLDGYMVAVDRDEYAKLSGSERLSAEDQALLALYEGIDMPWIKGIDDTKCTCNCAFHPKGQPTSS